jgi:hypothetical protein
MKPLLSDTFQSRGVMVPFENPKLRPVRLRASAGQRPKEWEAVFENYAGAGDRQNLIMQWIHVPSWVQMNARDRALFDAIGGAFADAAPDPLAMRALALQADRDHAENPETREIAKARLDGLRKDRFQAYISLLAQATRECGTARGDPVMAKANSLVLMAAIRATPGENADAGAALTDKVFGYLSAQAKVPLVQVVQRIEAVSDILAPIGAINLDADPGARQEGHLALSFARLEAFRAALQDYEKTTRDEAANRAMLVQFSAVQFRDYVADRLSDIEQKLSFFVAVVRDHAAVCDLLTDWARDIAFALDGWGELIDVWDEAQAAFERNPDPYILDLAVQHILLYLPTMPRAETDSETERVWNGLTFQRTRMVRQLTNWIDGSVDKDIETRIKAARKAEAERKEEEARAAQKALAAKAKEQARLDARRGGAVRRVGGAP